MRNLTNVLVVFVLIGVGFTSCKDSTVDKQKETSTTDQETPASNAEEKAVAETVLNANLATEADLKTLGLTAAIVTQIIEARPFNNLKDLDAILGDVDREALYKKLFVPLNLNTTAEADFKKVPGVGDRMAHEFEEYRPYTSVKQFKREIGKYVDQSEVERYLNYVFVPIELNSATEEDILALPGVGKRMAHEFEEYRPYISLDQFRKEIGKYVNDKELIRLERLVYLKEKS